MYAIISSRAMVTALRLALRLQQLAQLIDPDKFYAVISYAGKDEPSGKGRDGRNSRLTLIGRRPRSF